MKKTIAFLLLFALSVLLASCFFITEENEVLVSVGKYSKIAFYTSGVFQDYTDYGKYQLEAPNLEDNSYFTKIDEASKESLLAHLDNYETWVERCAEDIPYDFDRSIITDDDYLYIYDNEKCPEYESYNIWFFDAETKILYFFHNNS